MAISLAVLAEIASGDRSTDGTSFALAAANVHGSKPLLMAVWTSKAAAPGKPSSISGGSYTWVEVNDATFDTAGAPTKRLTVYRTMPSSADNGRVFTVEFATTHTGCYACLLEVTGSKTSGTQAADAILASGNDSANTDEVTSMPIAATTVGNLMAMFVGLGSGTTGAAFVASAGTELKDVGYATPTLNAWIGHQTITAGPSGLVEATFEAPSSHGLVLLELAAVTPVISRSPTSLSFGNVTQGGASAALTSEITGSDLTAVIVATTTDTATWEVSTNGSTWADSVNIDQISGSAAATLYVRVKRTATSGGKSANVTLDSTGATQQTIALLVTVVATGRRRGGVRSRKLLRG